MAGLRHFLRLRSWMAGALALAVTAMTAGDSAEAKRYRFGSSSSSKSTSAPASSAASGASRAHAPAKMTALDAALIGMQVQRITRNKLRFLYELPPMKTNTLPDGRHFHIGEVSRFLLGGRLVGWIGRSEYVDLKSDHLATILDQVGFKSVAAFEAHLAKTGPQRAPGQSSDTSTAAADTAADSEEETSTGAAAPAVGYSTTQLAMLGIGGAGLLGFLGYCLVSWQRNRSGSAAATRVTSGLDRRANLARPAARQSSAPAQAASAPPAEMPSRAAASVRPTPTAQPAAARTAAVPVARVATTPVSTVPRRAPRDLSALTRKPSPA